MIHLDKRQLLDLAALYIVANTPRSLFQGLAASTAVSEMRHKEQLGALAGYYGKITARAKRSELVIALAYAVLIGILLHKDNVDQHMRPDCSYLRWGPHMEELCRRLTPQTQIIPVYGTTAYATTEPGSATQASPVPDAGLVWSPDK